MMLVCSVGDEEACVHIDHRTVLKKFELFGVLEQICERLEPSETQSERAKSCYEAVGQWISNAGNDWLRSSSIYLQGSTALGTTVKPIGRNEYDVDLVCFLSSLGRWLHPAKCKQLVGDRLKEHQYYRAILEEKPRCWRLNYANEFHLDITPSIPNMVCTNGGELVPDKSLQCWKPTNPKGYRNAFQRRAELVPRMRMTKSMTMDSVRADADIEPYPEKPRFRGVLCRIVQIAKRHRDTYFLWRDESLLPISVIVTTLASWSYEYCVNSFVYDSELDVLCDVICHMPDFIEQHEVNGRFEWFIRNETTEGENFAERWNSEPARANAFFEWHNAAVADLDRLARSEGLDGLSKSLTAAFGQKPASDVLENIFTNVGSARRTGGLSLAPLVGLTVAPTARATVVRHNTFYGAP
jgi:hypothetical protein